MDNLKTKTASAALHLKEKAIEMHLGQRMFSAAAILSGILFILVFPHNFSAGLKILLVINMIDIAAIMFLKHESRMRLYADRLSEAMIFSILPFPWYGLVLINFVLAALKIEMHRNAPILPLKLMLLLLMGPFPGPGSYL